MQRIGIVGSGIAGLGCAWLLRDAAEVTLIEQDSHLGGHSNTRIVDEDGVPVPVDTGFIVFNKVTYPHLLQLFGDLGVDPRKSEMSFAVRHEPDRLEYNGMSLDKLFAQRGNLFRPSFHRMIRDIFRFFKLARASIETTPPAEWTLREFVARNQFGREFLEWYLLPMGSAVWSTDPRDMLDFPAMALIRFFHNHGFLGVTTHHQWYTVPGGARTYVERLLDRARPGVVRARAERVCRTSAEAIVDTAGAGSLRFDRVILACHADQALRLLSPAEPLERELLAPFRYQKNHATLHSDPRFMPVRRNAWASWNFLVQPDSGDDSCRASTHYWMNALQQVSKKRDYFVSLNCKGRIPDRAIFYETEYEHPVFNLAASQAQAKLPGLNRVSPAQRVFFCGSYFRHGFHEDAYASAVRLAEILLPLLRA